MVESESRELEFDVGELDEFNESDDDNQLIEDEASQMLKVWDRSEILREISDRLNTIKICNEAKESHLYDGETDFETLAESMMKVDDYGDVKIQITEHNPDGRKIEACHSILFDCIGYMEHDLNPFESTMYDGRPKKLNLVEGPILPGLLLGLLDLREGERANILIGPNKAFGELGVFSSNFAIPGDSTLLYHVKIHKIWDESQLDQVLEFEQGFNVEIPFETKLPYIEEHKKVANNYLKDGLIREAIVRYKAGIKLLEEIPHEMMYEDPTVSELMITLLQNVAIAYNKLGMHKTASKMAKKALQIDPTSTKAYYQLAKARLSLSDFLGASRWIEKGCRISPKSYEFDRLKIELNMLSKDERAKRDEIMKRMSKACK